MAFIGSGISIVGNLETNADVDQYDVVLNAGEVYDFWMGADTGGGNQISDAALQLDVSPGGPLVAFDDNSSDGVNATFLYSSTAGGTFRLTAEEVTNGGFDGGGFSLEFVNKSREADISDHTVANAVTVNGGGDEFFIAGVGTNAVLAEEDILNSSIINRPLLGTVDIDVVAVFLTAGHTYDFTVQGADSGVTNGIADSALTLMDANGIPVIADNDAGSDTTIAGQAIATTGWYFLQVLSAFPGGNYRLFFDDTGGGATAFDVAGSQGPQVLNIGGDFDAGNPFNLPLGDTIQGNIEIAGDQDWYAINLVAGFHYRFAGEGGTLGNLTVVVHDSTGAAQAGAAASGAEPQTVDFTPATSGLYYIDIHGQTAGDTGSFALSSTLVSTANGDTAYDITGLADSNGTNYLGSDLVDSITGGNQGDNIVPLNGDDTVAGGLGDDQMHGNSVPGGGDDVMLGDAGNDSLTSVFGSNTLDGGADNDILTDFFGTDSLLGGTGDDIIVAGFGGDTTSDTADGGDGNDTITGSEGAADLLSGGTGDDSITGQGLLDTLLGGAGNDTLTAAANASSLDGGTNNDSLVGSGGNDTMAGGSGNDTFDNVGAGDLVTAGIGADHVRSQIGWTLDADEENLTLIGGATINGNGNTGANVIFGNNQANQLSGLAGSDIVNGGAGNDTLIGGAGKDLNTGSGGLDHIKFNALSDSGPTFATRDAINTFAHGDKIDLSAIDANANVAGNQAFTFSTAAALTGASGLLIVQQVATNAFLVLADVNGDHNADFSLNVYTAPGFGTFHAFDFIL